MTTLREAAEMALEVLEESCFPRMSIKHYKLYDDAIDALEAALAQPEPEPVAWMDSDGDVYPMPETEGWRPPHTLLYTHPPQRQPLTDEELVDIVGNCAADSGGWFRYHAFARAIERAHGIGEKE